MAQNLKVNFFLVSLDTSPNRCIRITYISIITAKLLVKRGLTTNGPTTERACGFPGWWRTIADTSGTLLGRQIQGGHGNEGGILTGLLFRSYSGRLQVALLLHWKCGNIERPEHQA